jgi:hypothetical protein
MKLLSLTVSTKTALTLTTRAEALVYRLHFSFSFNHYPWNLDCKAVNNPFAFSILHKVTNWCRSPAFSFRSAGNPAAEYIDQIIKL